MTPRAVRSGVDGLLLAVVLAVIWEALHLVVGDLALTSPWQTALAAAALLRSPDFWPHAAETGGAVLRAYVLAVGLGLPVGVLLGAHRLSGEVAEPVLVALYSIPKIALYPVILLLFGIGMAAKVAFGTIHGVVPVAIFAMNAVRAIDPIHLRTARVLRLPPIALTRSILLPAAVPGIVTGLRVGFALTLVGTLMGEMFAAQRGVGYVLMQAMGVHDMKTILSVTLILVAVAVAVSVAMLRVDRRLHHGATPAA